jgi:hypothetical protein
MAVFLDKTTTKVTWLRDDLPSVLVSAITNLRLALQKTPIYFEGNKRVKAHDLLESAKSRIPKYLGKHEIDFMVLSEQEISKHYNQVISKDRLDLFIQVSIDDSKWVVIVEFDSARADQVAKKFVSRVAQVPNSSLIYIAFCYSGTKSMNLNEVNKYFVYMESISKSLNLAGFVGMAPPKNRGDIESSPNQQLHQTP